MNPDVIDVHPLDNFILRPIFEGGKVRDFDVKPYLELVSSGSCVRSPNFQEAHVEFGSVEWPHGLGLSYDTLYLESAPATMTV